MNYTIRAVETPYRGMLMRSRLEARWALFFDKAGVRYEYEPDRFRALTTTYLPDFWLPDFQTFIEIKPSGYDITTDAKATGFAVALAMERAIHQANDRAAWELMAPLWEAAPRGADGYVLPEVSASLQQTRAELIGPEKAIPDYYALIGLPFAQDGLFSYSTWRHHAPSQPDAPPTAGTWHETGHHWGRCPLCGRTLLLREDGTSVEDWGDAIMSYCEWCDIRDRRTDSTEDGYFHKGFVVEGRPGVIFEHLILSIAYHEARSARFERGTS